ncbi:MAG: GNAT family N-acetyltransferase [Coriobacteriia bacterium]|nr:GNAT family N-acetyltransferase [Coriobacteriia bacterium]
MSQVSLQPATEAELDAVWSSIRAARIFRRRIQLDEFHRAGPWRVRVAPGGRAALVERWRDALSTLAIRGLWCNGPETAAILAELKSVAAAQGYSEILSPLLAPEAVTGYRKAGLQVSETLVAFRMDPHQAAALAPVLPVGVRLRPALAADIPALTALDAICFDRFWAYEAWRLVDALVDDRLVVATGDTGIIGYTLSTVDRGSGTIGRVAVHPDHRGRGVGAALLGDAANGLAQSGAGMITLCTQTYNHAALALYEGVGMRRMTGQLVLMTGSV